MPPGKYLLQRQDSCLFVKYGKNDIILKNILIVVGLIIIGVALVNRVISTQLKWLLTLRNNINFKMNSKIINDIIQSHYVFIILE